MEANDVEMPSLLADVELDGFDVTPSPHAEPSPVHPSRARARVPPLERVPRRSEVVFPPLDSPFQAPGYRSVQPVSISLPASPTGFGVPLPIAMGAGQPGDLRRQAMSNAAREAETAEHQTAVQGKEANNVRFVPPDKVVFRSQPIPGGKPPTGRATSHRGGWMMSRDRRYDSFKTWSGKLERQLTHLAGAGQEVPEEEDGDGDAISSQHTKSMPQVDRFFDALHGPELDQLRVSFLNSLQMAQDSSVLLCCNSGAHSWRVASVIRGAGSAVGQDVAVPAPVPGVGVRYLPRREQPGDPVEDGRDVSADEISSRHHQGEPCALVRLRGAHVHHRGHLRLQGGLLLRGRPPGVLPPDQGQLLLRAVDCLPLLSDRCAAVRGDGATTLALVRAHGASAVHGAQDIRAVDVRRAEAAVQGGEPVEPPVDRRQLRRCSARRLHGAQGGARLLLRRRAGALHRAVCDAVPAAPDERDAAQGAAPGVLPLRGGAERGVHGVGEDHRRVRPRVQGRLLRRHVPVHVARRQGQLLQGVQVLAGVVGVHVPDDRRRHRVHPLLHGGGQRLHQGALRRALRGGHAHRDGAPGHHDRPRLRAPEPLPQRHLHRHHRTQGQTHRGAAGEARRQQ